MSLARLKAQNFRNFVSFDIETSPGFNIIYGNNGSGKTSILECIYFLGLGRSFRTHLNNRIIQHAATALTVFGSVNVYNGNLITVGIEKNKHAKLKLKLANENVQSIAEFAKVLPLQLINPDSFNLLTHGPRLRREFLDWGVFHVEPLFLSVWKRFRKLLAQRNAALQCHLSLSQIKAWDEELIPTANKMSDFRKKYCSHLIPLVKSIFANFIEINNFSLEYFQGWDFEKNLVDLLESSYFRDKSSGYTQFGPHKADIIGKIDNVPIQDRLSRGEQKLLICALKLAQGILLKKLTGKTCIYMLDDLTSELDTQHQNQVLDIISTLDAQVFITVINRKSINKNRIKPTDKLFHVEKNKITNVNSI